MADSVLTYLLCLQNFGRYTNEARAIELISTYRHQIKSDIVLFTDVFPIDTRVGELIRREVEW